MLTFVACFVSVAFLLKSSIFFAWNLEATEQCLKINFKYRKLCSASEYYWHYWGFR